MSDHLNPYEKTQRIQILSAIIWIVFGASLTLGLINIQFKPWGSVIGLFALALICIFLLHLNSKWDGLGYPEGQQSNLKNEIGITAGFSRS